MTRYIKLLGDKVVSVRFGPSIVKGEIESAIGEVGQVYDPVGKTFSTPAATAEPAIDVPKTLREIKDHYDASAALLDKIKKKLGIT